ncbi:S49 family peptidase [Candidatus Hepatincolaceae symbiont of Richtersius coronifer]
MFKKKNVVNVVKLAGVISSSGAKALSLENTRKLIDKAFANKKAAAVAFIINSPGGSPVQSEMIANYILHKAQESKIKTLAFIEEAAASGGYWLAVTADQIYALSKSSIVGSLGVVYAGFGLEEFIENHGIKRRVYTAGKHKVSLDMFQEEKPEDIARLKEMLAEVHKHFKEWVLKRRAARIKIDLEKLFSGEFWVASQGLEYGLIDGISDLQVKLKELYGKNVEINFIAVKRSFLSKIPFLGVNNYDNLIDAMLNKLKAEVQWNKFGL